MAVPTQTSSPQLSPPPLPSSFASPQTRMGVDAVFAVVLQLLERIPILNNLYQLTLLMTATLLRRLLLSCRSLVSLCFRPRTPSAATSEPKQSQAASFSDVMIGSPPPPEPLLGHLKSVVAVENSPEHHQELSSIFSGLLGQSGLFLNRDRELWSCIISTVRSATGCSPSDEKNSFPFPFNDFVADIVHRHVRTHLTPKFKDGAVVDLGNELRRFTFNVMCSITMGRVPGRLEKEHARFADAFENAIRDAKQGRPAHQNYPEIDDFVLGMINSTLEEARDGVGHCSRNDLLSRLFSSLVDGDKGGNRPPAGPLATLISRDCDPERKRAEVLRDTALSFLVAGTEVAAAVMTKLFELVTTNARCEEALRKEVEGLKGYKNQYLLKRMDYAHACVSETLRLHPPVLPTESTGKAGVCADAAEFRPERWVDGRGMYIGAEDGWGFAPFKAGSGRKCLGEEKTYIVAKSVAAAVLSHFKLEMVGQVEGGESPGPGGLKVRLTKRVKDEGKAKA